MLNKICGLSRQDSGVGYYRVLQPTMFIDKYTKDKCRVTPFHGTNKPIRIGLGDSSKLQAWNDKTLMWMGKDADVIWTTILFDYDEILKVMDLRRWSGAKWIVDMDDNFYAVGSDNPGQSDAKLLRENFEKCLTACDGITVSVPALKEVYGHLNENIYVNPNGVDFRKGVSKMHPWWSDLSPIKHKKIRIGWRGAYGHRADVVLCEPAIKKLKEKYDIEFVSFGVKPPFDSEFHDWVPFLDYPKALNSLALDIAVVPLVDSSYNRCKSNLAVQEFSALKVPVVASPVENQKGMDGVLYATNNYEWYEQLEKLIKSKQLRQEQAKAQYKFLRKNYDMKVLTKPLMEWMSTLPRKDQ